MARATDSDPDDEGVGPTCDECGAALMRPGRGEWSRRCANLACARSAGAKLVVRQEVERSLVGSSSAAMIAEAPYLHPTAAWGDR